MDLVFSYDTRKGKLGIPTYFQTVSDIDPNANTNLTLYSASAKNVNVEKVIQSINTYFYDKFDSYPGKVNVMINFSLMIEVLFDSSKFPLEISDIANFVEKDINLNAPFNYVSSGRNYISRPIDLEKIITLQGLEKSSLITPLQSIDVSPKVEKTQNIFSTPVQQSDILPTVPSTPLVNIPSIPLQQPITPSTSVVPLTNIPSIPQPDIPSTAIIPLIIIPPIRTRIQQPKPPNVPFGITTPIIVSQPNIYPPPTKPLTLKTVQPIISPPLSPAIETRKQLIVKKSNLPSDKILTDETLLPLQNLAVDPMAVFRNLQNTSYNRGEPIPQNTLEYSHMISHRYVINDEIDYPKRILAGWNSYDKMIQVYSVELSDDGFGVFTIRIHDSSNRKLNLKDPNIANVLLSRYISNLRIYDKDFWDSTIIISIKDSNKLFYGPAYRENCVLYQKPDDKIDIEEAKTFDTCLKYDDLVNVFKLLAPSSAKVANNREEIIKQISFYLGTFNQELWKERIYLIFWNILRLGLINTVGKEIPIGQERLLNVFNNAETADKTITQIAETLFGNSSKWKLYANKYPQLWEIPYVKERSLIWRDKDLNRIKNEYYSIGSLIDKSLKPILSVRKSEYITSNDIDRILSIFEQKNNEFQYIPVYLELQNTLLENEQQIKSIQEIISNTLDKTSKNNLLEQLSLFEKSQIKPNIKPNTKYLGTVFNTLTVSEIEKQRTSFTIGGSHWVAAFVDLNIPDKRNIILEYADSLAGPISEVKDPLIFFINQINPYLIQNGYPIISINNVKTLSRKKQSEGTECGVYAIQFIDMRLSGVSFEQYNELKIPDEYCSFQREYYWRASKKRSDYLSYMNEKDKCYSEIDFNVSNIWQNDQPQINSKMKILSDYIINHSKFIIKLKENIGSLAWDLSITNIEKNAALDEFSKKTNGAAGFLITTVINEELNVLLQLKKTATQNYWNIPGGKIENNDINFIHTAMREFWEEAGLNNPINVCEASDFGLVKDQSKNYYLIIANFPFDYVGILDLNEGKPQEEVDTTYTSPENGKKWFLSPGYEWFTLEKIQSYKNNLVNINFNLKSNPEYNYDLFLSEAKKYAKSLAVDRRAMGLLEPFSIRSSFMTSNLINNIIDPYLISLSSKTLPEEIVQSENIISTVPITSILSTVPIILPEKLIPGENKYTYKLDCDYHDIGNRNTQEDTSLSLYDDPYGIYAVFDGHGGNEISIALVDKFKEMLLSLKSENPENVPEFIRNYFIKIDKSLLQKMPNVKSGSTATAVVFDANRGKLYVVNLGDSKTIVFTKKGDIIFESGNYGFEKEDEKNRAQSKGWEITGRNENRRIENILNVSRAFGDFEFKQTLKEGENIKNATLSTYDPEGGVSVIPDIKEIDLLNDTYYVILACDGLWDFYQPSSAVINYLLSRINTQEVNKPLPSGLCKELAKDAINKYNSGDNVSVMIVSILKNLK